MDYHQPRFYHFSEDSIWLSKKASELSPNACSVLDIGCGSGVVGIETLNRLKSPKELILLEPQVEFLEYIQNNLEFIERNIEVEIVNQTLERFNPGRKYDLIVSNPPYFNPKESSPEDVPFTCNGTLPKEEVLFIIKEPADVMRALSLPAVSNEIVSLAGNLIFVFPSPK